MKIFSAHISGLLGLLMIAATLLPSLHALGHDLDANEIAQESKVKPVAVDCDLCDFNFSSLDLPEYSNYDSFIPGNLHVYTIPVQKPVYTFTLSLFSLRAPPAVTA